jgi:phospholipid transport system substrate-binding protein
MALSQTASDNDVNRLREDLEKRLDVVLSIIEKEELDDQTKRDKVAEIVEPLLDFAMMSKLALGKTHWFALNDEEKNRFTELFTQRLRESYLKSIYLYADEKITFETPVQEKNKIQIPTRVITKDDTMTIVYKFYKTENDWKIYDVEIEGVSLISSYRSQFNENLQSSTIEELFRKLEEMEAIQ